MNQKSRKTELLKKIAELFYKNGYEQTSTREIAKHLNMTIAGLYYYFKSKQEMLFDIMNNAIEEALVSINQEVGKIKNPDDKIAWIIRGHIKFYCENKFQTKVLINEKQSLGTRYATIIKKKEKEYVDLIKRILREIIEEEWHAVIPIEIATFSLLAMLNWTVQWYNPEGKITPNKLADTITRIFLNGIKGGK